jgi:two-component system response regulator PilR (NtrC family)
MDKKKVLVIDDEADICELISLSLSKIGVDSVTALDINSAKQQLQQHDFNLCLTDLCLPDGSGIEVVEHIQQKYPCLPVAVITAYGSMELAVKALKAGAFDFVSKPVNLKILRNLVEMALKLSLNDAKLESHQLLGNSAKMQVLKATIAKLSRSQAPVVIHGESGTGKELVARIIHDKSPRREGPFVAVNCGAIPSELVESELFGHKKGSFTGASSNADGLFKAANKGTIFLDEVAELPRNAQVKLLRVIQEKTLRAVGAQHEQEIDVRILSATNIDLTSLVKSGQFRQDLFYRINVIEVIVPPLRERLEDLDLLVNSFLAKLKDSLQVNNLELAPDAMQALQSYNFPGNVRELENILHRASALSENNLIAKQDLDLPVSGNTQISVSNESLDLDTYLSNVEYDAIQQALDRNNGDKKQTAKELGLSLRSLRYRMSKLGFKNMD